MEDISYLASSRFKALTPEVRESDQLLLNLLLGRLGQRSGPQRDRGAAG